MIVCHCLAVNDRALRQAIESGANDLDDLAAHCGAGDRCGGCRPMLARLLALAGRDAEAVPA